MMLKQRSFCPGSLPPSSTNTANILLYLFVLLIPPPPLPSNLSLTRTKDVILSYVTHSYNEWHIIFQKQNIYRNYPILHGKNKDIFIILSQDKGIALNQSIPLFK